MKPTCVRLAVLIATAAAVCAEPAPLGPADLPEAATKVVGTQREGVADLAFAADGRAIVFLSRESRRLNAARAASGVLRVVDTATGRIRLEATIEDNLYSASLSPDAGRAAAGCPVGDKTGASGATVWDVASGKVLYTAEAPPACWSSDSKTLVVRHRDTGEVLLLDAATGKVLKRLPCFRGQAFDMRCVGKKLVALGHNGQLKGEARLWDLESGAVLLERSDFEGPLMRYAATADDSERGWGYTGGLVRLWNLKSMKYTREYDSSGRAPAWSPDGDAIAIAWGDSVTIHRSSGDPVKIGGDLPPLRPPVRPKRGHGDTEPDATTVIPLITHTEFSPDGGEILVCGRDGTGSLWSTTTGVLEARFASPRRGTDPEIMDARWAPDGRSFVTAAATGDLLRWDRDALLEAWKGRAKDGK